MIWRGVLLLMASLLGTSASKAEWLEAKSRHFILYADSNQATLKRQAEELERFDWSLRRFMSTPDEPEIASRKLTVFLVDDDDIRRLCRCRNAAGFYISRVSGSIAFSGNGGWSTAQDGSRLVLFHEYAHHFLLGSFDLAFPKWFSEGFAELASTTRIEDERAVIGYPAQHRAYALVLGDRLRAEQVFEPSTKKSWTASEMDSFYGRSWLMTHYMTFDPARFEKFRSYIAEVNRGSPNLLAAQKAFGDMRQLDRELSAYLKKSRLSGVSMRYGDAAVPPVAIRPLSKGEAAMIAMRMESVRGVNEESGRKLYAKAAPLAVRHPDDPIVQGWFAEMAHDADEDAAAEKAAANALAKDPASVQALLYRGMVQLRRLEREKSTDNAAWGKARASIVAANRAQPDNAQPLWWYWQSFGMQGREPIPSSIQGLYKAQELVPQDGEVRLAAAITRIAANEVDEAKALLRPLAYHPHAEANNPASQMIAALDAGKKGHDVITLAAPPMTGDAAKE